MFDGSVGDQLRIAVNREEVELGMRPIVVLLAGHILEWTGEVSLGLPSDTYIRVLNDFDAIIVIVLIDLVKLRSHVLMFIISRQRSFQRQVRGCRATLGVRSFDEIDFVEMLLA